MTRSFIGRLFTTFDPSVGVRGVNLNWLRITLAVLLPTRAWGLNSRALHVIQSVGTTLANEIKLVNISRVGIRASLVLSRVFILIVVNNFLGLMPYVFTSTRHIRFTLPLGLALWLGVVTRPFLVNNDAFIAHLVPKGTPKALIPFIVLIEVVRSITRPFTLAIRLAANMVAGHLLLVLASSPAPFVGRHILRLVIVGVVLLSILETGVAIIQGYVFVRLTSLYLREVNNAQINFYNQPARYLRLVRRTR